MSTSAPASIPAKAPAKSLHAIGLGAVGEWIMASTVNNLMMPIFTTGFGLNPVLVSWASTLPRLLDAITDPLVGHWSDNTRTRWGRRKPFLVAGGLGGAFMMVALWWCPLAWSHTSQFLYLFVVNLLFWFAFTLYTMPTYALVAELSLDFHDRTRVMMMRSIYCSLPTLGVGWVYWLTLRPIFGGEINGIRWTSAGLAVLVVFCALMPVLFVKERYATRHQEPQSFLRSLKSALANRQFQHAISIRLLVMLGAQIFNGLSFYLNTYYACGSDKMLATKILGISGTVHVLATFLALPLTPWIGRRFGKIGGLRLGAGLFALAAMLGWVLITPSAPYLQIGMALITGPAAGIFGTFMASFGADICDIDELNHGRRREGVFGAVTSFLTKVEASILALTVGYGLSFSGFSAALGMQDEYVLWKLRLFALLPYGCFTVLGLILAWHFPITQQLMTEVRAELDRNAAKNHGEPHPLV
ncbi:MAG: MFS transporter [Nitrospira sp.]|nr:MFS transporter [Nitrospira sp.]